MSEKKCVCKNTVNKEIVKNIEVLVRDESEKQRLEVALRLINTVGSIVDRDLKLHVHFDAPMTIAGDMSISSAKPVIGADVHTTVNVIGEK